MNRYIGGDVHQASVTFVVLSETGKKIRSDIVETNGAALVDYIKQQPGQLHLCIEEGEWSNWLHELLERHVTELVIYRARLKLGSKSDAIDAQGLAEKLRSGQIKRGVYKSTRLRELREASRAYTKTTRDVARVKSRIKSLYRSRGLSCEGGAVYKPEDRGRQIQRLPSFLRSPMALFGEELDHLTELKGRAEHHMLELSRRHRITRILETVPGMGPVRVAQLVPIVVTPHRFRTKRQFWAYCGFSIVTHSSDDWVKDRGRWIRKDVIQTRGLTRNYNRTLKMIFKGAATTVTAHSGPNRLRADFDRLLEQGTRPNLAKLTIARKIAAIVLAMWKQEERYDPER